MVLLAQVPKKTKIYAARRGAVVLITAQRPEIISTSSAPGNSFVAWQCDRRCGGTQAGSEVSPLAKIHYLQQVATALSSCIEGVPAYPGVSFQEVNTFGPERCGA